MRYTTTLLLVDGHDGVRTVLAAALRRAGFGVVAEARTVAAALRQAREQAPHLVLFDPRTVQGDALEAIRLLGEEGRHVLVYTSSLLHEEEALLAAGGARVAFKGMARTALCALIESLIATE
jgi:DNA-binding NarL/FixJ family response regulator